MLDLQIRANGVEWTVEALEDNLIIELDGREVEEGFVVIDAIDHRILLPNEDFGSAIIHICDISEAQQWAKKHGKAIA